MGLKVVVGREHAGTEEFFLQGLHKVKQALGLAAANVIHGIRGDGQAVVAGVLPADYDFEAHKQLVPMQPGDVPVTYADSTALERDFGFTPKIPLREGLRRFAEWYKEYYG